MTNLKLSINFIHSWQIASLATTLGWDKHRTLGAYVHLLANTQAQGIEGGSKEALQPMALLPPKACGQFFAALTQVGLLREGATADEPAYVLLHNEGLAARRARRQEIGRAAGQKSGSARKAEPAKRRGRKPKAETAATETAAIAAVPAADKTPTVFQRHCSVAWAAYHDAYLKTTNQPPVRNAKANSLIQSIVKQLGHEAPEVLQFYCRHPKRLYVAAVYPLDLASRDAQGLRTQWLNDRYITDDNVRQQMDDGAYQARLRKLQDMSS